MPSSEFTEGAWESPIDMEAVCQAVPEKATIRGMFLQWVIHEAALIGEQVPGARERYVPFQQYPLREHAELIARAQPIFFPDLAPRRALRTMGRAGPKAFLSSTLGRVTLGSVEGVQESIEAMAKAYGMNMDPGSANVIEKGSHHAIVRMRDIHDFLDTLHVGAFEGVLGAAGATGATLRILAHSPTDADFRLEW